MNALHLAGFLTSVWMLWSSKGKPGPAGPLLLVTMTSYHRCYFLLKQVLLHFDCTWLIRQPGSFLLKYLSQRLLIDSGENSEEVFFHSFSPYRHMFPLQVSDTSFLSFLPISWSHAGPPGCASSWSPVLFSQASWTLAPSWSLWVSAFTTSFPLLSLSPLSQPLSLLPEQKGTVTKLQDLVWTGNQLSFLSGPYLLPFQNTVDGTSTWTCCVFWKIYTTCL